jgi:CHAP domain-containing protein
LSLPKWPTTALERVLFMADTQVNVTETPANTNTGPKVEEYLATVQLAKGQPWCAAFVAWVGTKAIGSEWPLPLVGGCQTLYEKAKAQGLVKEKPARGDVFLIWFPSKNRFAHTGFVVEVRADKSCATIEGNTSGQGSREGWGAFARVRTFGELDRFIRWA